MRLLMLPLLMMALNADAAETSAADSYRYLRAARAEAQRLSEPQQASTADLRQAVEKYQGLLAYLERPEVAERASGDTGLQSEYVNVLYPLAQAYAKLGMREQALAALERATRRLWLPAMPQLLASPAFDSMRADPRFKAILKTNEVPARVYGGAAIATPYKEVLSTEEKVAGLSLFWAEARRNFAHFDHVPDLNWDQVYMEYLTRVIAAPTTRDYYAQLMQLAPLLRDGHTNIYPPQQLVDTFYAAPPVATALVEGRVLVTRLGNAALAARLRVGDEIVAVDGQPVREYAEQKVAPFASASTPQDKAVRMYTYQLLAGDIARPVTLSVRDAGGAERAEVVARGGKYEGRKPFEFRMLPGQIAYLSLDQFESDDGVKRFEAVLPEILKAKGLVLDVRRNGGGNSDNGLLVLSYLSREPIATSAGYVRVDDAVVRAQAGPHILWEQRLWGGEQKFSKARKDVYTGPVAVLTSAMTYSAAEDFAVAFRGMKRGIIVGEATGGSTGQPLMVDLPGGGSGRICVKRDTYPDGTPFVGIGVLPDVEAHPTVASVRSGADPVLERAVAELQRR